jgi:hypothetical protein
MMTLKKINQALDKKFDGQLQLQKGKEYFYFSGKLSEQMITTGIYTGQLQSLSPEKVIKAAERAIEFYNS